jgi:hypothetical protein
VRLVDVRSERNDRVNRFLNEANKLPGALSGVMPHPVLPAVSTAIEAARLILANQNNIVLLDFQVNFFSNAQQKGAATDLLPLRKGEWVVVGRPMGLGSEFWQKAMYLSSRTGDLTLACDDSEKIVNTPYVSLALMQADAAIPQHILDRTQVFLQMLDSPTERKNIDSLESAFLSLESTVAAYKSERALKSYGTKYDLEKIVDLAKKYNQALEDGSAPLLLPAQVRSLLDTVNEFTNNQFSSFAEFTGWWQASGSKGKALRQEDGSFRWALP